MKKIVIIKSCYELTKPGLVYGNLVPTLGGFLLASQGHLNIGLLCTTVLGIGLVMASGCVFNCYLDRDIDAMMKRTQNRVMVLGLVSKKLALIYATTLLAAGLLILLVFNNLLVLLIASIGFFVYVVLYSIWLKRISIHSTLVGSIAGAAPIIVGYCSSTGSFDQCAVILFLILAAWQMPHSYALYIGYLEDYARASISTLPVKKGIYWTKINIILYVIIFFAVSVTLSLFKYVGNLYLIVMILLNSIWVILAYSGFYTVNSRLWAKRMFFYSILVIIVFAVLISFDGQSRIVL